MELYEGSLDIKEIFARWLDEAESLNYGAYIPFVGTIRQEDGIEALSFDIYEPLLQQWLKWLIQKEMYLCILLLIFLLYFLLNAK